MSIKIKELLNYDIFSFLGYHMEVTRVRYIYRYSLGKKSMTYWQVKTNKQTKQNSRQYVSTPHYLQAHRYVYVIKLIVVVTFGLGVV